MRLVRYPPTLRSGRFHPYRLIRLNHREGLSYASLRLGCRPEL